MVNSINLNSIQNPLYLDIANRIGNSVCRDALWDGDRCTWLGWSQENHGQSLTPVYRACGADLYSGTSGIALFLAELYQFTHDKQQLRTIEGAVNQALSVYSKLPSAVHHGFYSGINGIAFALIRIGEILQRDALIERGLSMLDGLRNTPLDVKNIDVISGSAGAIPALLTIAKKYQRENLTELAYSHGQHLVQLAEHGEHGCSWSTIGSAVKANLTGHSHGAAGIATALLELYEVTKEVELLNTAQAAIRYENHWFRQDESNWLDLRQNSNNYERCSMAWCHGAPGIGLSRLRSSKLFPDNTLIKQDLESALQSSAANLMLPWAPGKLNYSLCHGATGNAELVMMAASELQRPELMEIAEKVAQEGYEFYVKQGLPWPCGNSGAGESYGLMLGKAGIAYFYLRLFSALKVPSILFIAPSLE